MRLIKRFLLRLFINYFWYNHILGLRSVLGHKSLSSSIKEMNDIENEIRLKNSLKLNEKITWENSNEVNREVFAKYTTLKYFNEVGELLAFFRAVDKKKITGRK